MRGNRWYKCDLHIHTTASQCFRDRNVTAEQWVNRCIEQELDCVAITDHNTGNSIDEYKRVANEKGLIVFPGLELTYGENGIHLLVLFDLNKTSEHVNDFLISVGISRNDFATPNACSNLTFSEIVQKANESDALIIPAHIDEFKGLQESTLDHIQDCYTFPDITAVQVVNKDLWELQDSVNATRKQEIAQKLNEKYGSTNFTVETVKKWHHPIAEAKKSNKAILTFSDNPHALGDSKHGLFGIGTRYSWIKMDEQVSLNSLRQALMLNSIRVKSDFESLTSPYQLPNTYIKSLNVSNTHLSQDEFHVDFSPQMTAIIGGRGTGKSSIVRFLRGILNKDRDLVDFEELLKDHQNFYTVRSTGEIGILKADTQLELEIYLEDTLFKIQTNGSSSLAVSRYNDESLDFENVDIGYLHTYLNDCDIYSQKQIYEMAQNPNTLRDRIDEESELIQSLKENLVVLGNQYKEKTRQIKTLELQLHEKESLLLHRNELKRKLEKFSEGSYKTIADNYKLASLERKQYLEITSLFSQKLEYIASTKETMSLSLPQELHGKSGEVISIINNKINDYNQMLEMIFNDFSRFVTELNESYSQEVQATNWYTDYLSKKERYDQLKDELQDEEMEQLKNLSELSGQLESLEEKLTNFELLENEKNQLIIDQETVLHAHKRSMEEITRKRREFLQNVMSNSGNVKINVKAQRDIANFINNFRRIIQKPTGYDEGIRKIEENIYTNNWSIHQLKEIILRTKRGEDTTTFDGRFRRMITSLNDEQLDEITILFPEDEIEVRYKPNENGQFKSLSTASAGQKTSAILTFLLSYGNSPLILDQPEDDLDNQLIHNLIVDRLLRCKETRQVIVITHNANIPVNGDAEWVTSLDSDTRDISIFNSGSVDNPDIKKKICDIMEGGEKAFTLRALRYGFNK
ncbi:TrlF family AAA-like ATPase [Bacillus mycoides]|uniref:TrlF family AAA-like ATPase n=1 Tax=Bacillus mycoides TaxID=1405 RepID=UPI00148508A0|nr:PHP domain-containing protein [Bacillus mycoides]